MITYIRTECLDHHPDNPRKDLGDLTELAASIRQSGVLQNLTVVPQLNKDDVYTVVIGHRRLEAAKLAHLDEVPCSIVEMTPKAQIATMLQENIQRSDLTVYEQAQGFQMMLNLGDTVSTISTQTGFSESTVRRRVNLLELDEKKFKESIERGATLSDYVKLEQLEDVSEKNRVLGYIGTVSFNNMLQSAIDSQKRRACNEQWRIALSKVATELETFSYSEYKTCQSIQTSRNPDEFEEPEDMEGIDLFFNVDQWGWARILVRSEDMPVRPSPGLSPEEAERREREQMVKSGLSEATERAYRLRWDFLQGITKTTIKNHFADVVEHVVFASDECDGVARFLGVDFSDDEDDEAVDCRLSEAISENPEKAMIALAHRASCDGSNNGYFLSWNLKYDENQELDALYAFLVKLGYGMSDEELALQNGTHELFEKPAPEDGPSGERKCRVCGCTENNACLGGCSWVENDLCSACTDADPDDPYEYPEDDE